MAAEGPCGLATTFEPCDRVSGVLFPNFSVKLCIADALSLFVGSHQTENCRHSENL